MQISGKIYKIFETRKVKDSFRKRDFVLETTDDSNFRQLIKFEFIQDKCDILDNFSEQEQVVVDFNIRGREWKNNKGEITYFVSLQAWKLTKEDSQQVEEDAF